MYSLGFLCLLAAAVALPTPEQLHTNLPELPSPPELKLEEEEQHILIDPPAPIPDLAIEEPDKSDESKNASESEDKLVNQIGEGEDVHDQIDLAHKESKESKDSKELENPKEQEKPGEPQEDKKEKDSKEESINKEGEEEEFPVVIEVIQGSSILDWLDKFIDMINGIKWPFSRRRSELHNGELHDQPIYIVKEPEFAFE